MNAIASQETKSIELAVARERAIEAPPLVENGARYEFRS